MKLQQLLLLGALMGALMGTSSACFAHTDTIVSIAPDGTMDAIPDEFLPARLNVAFASPRGKQAFASVTLRLGENQTTLPGCIVAQLPSRTMAQVSAGASWYHDDSGTLPYYVSVNFAEPRRAAVRGRT